MDNYFGNGYQDRREMEMEQRVVIGNVNMRTPDDWKDKGPLEPGYIRLGAYDVKLDGNKKRHSATCAFKIWHPLCGGMEGGHPTAHTSLSGAVLHRGTTADRLMRCLTYTGTLQNNQIDGTGAGEGKNTTIISGSTTIQRVQHSSAIGPGDLIRVWCAPTDDNERIEVYANMDPDLKDNPMHVPFIHQKVTKSTFTDFVHASFNPAKFQEEIITPCTHANTPVPALRQKSLQMLHPARLGDIMTSGGDVKVPTVDEQVSLGLAGLVLAILDAGLQAQATGTTIDAASVRAALKTYASGTIDHTQQQSSMRLVHAVLEKLAQPTLGADQEYNEARRDLWNSGLSGLASAYDASCEHVIARAVGFGTEDRDGQVDVNMF